jgi:hypothetical protein
VNTDIEGAVTVKGWIALKGIVFGFQSRVCPAGQRIRRFPPSTVRSVEDQTHLKLKGETVLYSSGRLTQYSPPVRVLVTISISDALFS